MKRLSTLSLFNQKQLLLFGSTKTTTTTTLTPLFNNLNKQFFLIKSFNLSTNQSSFHHSLFLSQQQQQDYSKNVETTTTTETQQTIEQDENRFLKRGLKQFNTPKLIILLGPPGAGKGTQSRLITENQQIKSQINYHIISAGDILREESEKNENLKKLLNDGKLAPEEETAKFLLKKMNKIYQSYFELYSSKNGNMDEKENLNENLNEHLNPNFIIEGFPRNVIQAKYFLQWFLLSNNSNTTNGNNNNTENGNNNLIGDIHFSKTNTIIIHLLTDKECIKERLKGRLIHNKSGRTYHLEFRKPLSLMNRENTTTIKEEEDVNNKLDELLLLDDISKEPLEKRKDDLNDEAIINRMNTYKSSTLPTLEVLSDNGFEVIDIPSIEQNIEKVKQKVHRVLLEKGFLPKINNTTNVASSGSGSSNTEEKA
ncbi:hypothetical protein ABK040_010748 [Willaertia magna]